LLGVDFNMSEDLKIVVIGGGTGSFTVLSELKKYSSNITALVNMADDGGSTGQLRDEYGVLPPGDIRQCLVALSDAPQSVRDLFNFRFPGKSGPAGHSFGNLFLSAVEMMTDNFSQAVKSAAEVLNIRGRVLPVSLDSCELVMEADGKTIVGQSNISKTQISKKCKPKLYFLNKVEISDEAKKVVVEAELIVIAAGDLYTSLAPALLVTGMKQAISKTKAQIVYVCNLVNKDNHTREFRVTDYVDEIERIIVLNCIDRVLYNSDMPSDELLKKYSDEGEYPVQMNPRLLKEAKKKYIAGNFLSHEEQTRDKNDILLKRSLIRHDGAAIAAAIINIQSFTQIT
jgi:uncharacterized cofD-like protein